MSELPPLPPGFSLDGATPAVPPLPQGFTLDAPNQYTGAILPFSKNAKGETVFDSNAGIVGILKSAFTLPGDVATGKVPVTGQSTTWNPELISRSANFAALASPAPPSAALRTAPPVPSAQELKATGSAGYDAARASGLEFPGDAVGAMAGDLSGALATKGMIPKRVPQTASLVDELAAAPAGSTVTIDGLMAAREAFGTIRQEASASAADKSAARRAIEAIDHFLENPHPAAVVAGAAAPREVADILRGARQNYAAAERSNDLTGTLNRATTGLLERAEANAAASNSGLNVGNQIRQQVRTFLKSPEEVAGFSNAELAALRSVRDGTFARNRVRDVGNAFGGGGGVAVGLLGGLAGNMAPNPLAAAILGAGIPITGRLARMLDNTLTKRSLNSVDEMVRANSPMYQGLLDAAPINQPAFGRDAAVSKALYGLLAPYLRGEQGR